MTKDELNALIQDAVKASVSAEVDPLKQQVTNWGDAINSGGSDDSRLAASQKGLTAARIVRAIAAGRGDPNRISQFADKAYTGADREKIMTFFEKANEAQDFSTGGFMIPEDMSDDIIELLRPRSVMRAAGVPVVPMPRGTLTLPKQTGDVSANYVGESEDITKSEPTGGQIVLSAKKLAALVPISNDLLMFSGGDKADMFVRNSIVRRVGVREDRAFLRDDGTQNTPKGIRYWAANSKGQTGTSASQIEADLQALIQFLEGSDVDMTGPAWIMAPRSKNFLINLRDGNGNLIYPELRRENPTLLTHPVFISNNVPTNLGGGGNESEIYLVNVPDCLIAESGGMEITADSSASYVEGGNLVSAFSRDQMVIRSIVRHDFAVQYNEAVAVLTGVTYGV